MKHHIRIGSAGKERWIFHNERKSHHLSESLLEEIIDEAESNIWCDNRVHGRLLGQKLFDLLNGSGGLLHKIAKQPGAVNLQLPKDMMNLPFEIMWDGVSFITISANIPIIRQVPVANRIEETALENRPAKMLFMACSPQDSNPVLDFEAEEEAIVKQLEDEKLPVELMVEDSGSLNGLKLALREFEPCDIVHLTGHARMNPGGATFSMETETGFHAPVNPEELWAVLRNRAPKVLFL